MLDSGSSGPGSSPTWDYCVFPGHAFTLTRLLSSQVYKLRLSDKVQLGEGVGYDELAFRLPEE